MSEQSEQDAGMQMAGQAIEELDVRLTGQLSILDRGIGACMGQIDKNDRSTFLWIGGLLVLTFTAGAVAIWALCVAQDAAQMARDARAQWSE